MAREMGVRYITITTKHHEGFCLWDSKFTRLRHRRYALWPRLAGPAG